MSKDDIKEIPDDPNESALANEVESLVENFETPALLQPLFDSISEYSLLKAALVFLLFFLLAKLIVWSVVKVASWLTRRTATVIDDIVLKTLCVPLFWSVILAGILLAAQSLSIAEVYSDALISLVISVALLLWMLFAIRFSRILLTATSRKRSVHSFVQPQTLPLYSNMVAIAVVAIGVYFIFHVWKIDMTAWLASAGIVGIAVGFAAKDTLANLFAGVFIIADSPYKVGDYVVLDDVTGMRGKVTHIGIRSTRLLTRDDVEVTIPNSIMGNSKVINESGGPHVKCRIRVAIGVAYTSDVDKVKEVLLSVALETSVVCRVPEPRVRFRAFGPSSLDFELLCWVDDPELQGKVLDTLNTSVHKRFLAEKIEIPYSKQDLYIKEFPLHDKEG